MWRKVSECPPPKGECLVWGPRVGSRVFYVVSDYEEHPEYEQGRVRGHLKSVRDLSRIWSSGIGYESLNIVYWMPIPSVPEQEEKEPVLWRIEETLRRIETLLEGRVGDGT